MCERECDEECDERRMTKSAIVKECYHLSHSVRVIPYSPHSLNISYRVSISHEHESFLCHFQLFVSRMRMIFL
jgi:hypothetical protein